MSSITLVQKRAVISAFAAVGVHAFVLGVWILFIIWDLPLFAYQPDSMAPRPEPEVTVVMLPYVPKPPPPELPPLPVVKPEETKKPPPEVQETKPEQQLNPLAPVEPKRRFARTSEDQAGTPDAPTDILGERDTRAASEVAPTPGARPDTPAQEGAAPLYPGHIETVSKTYRDGSVGMDKQGEQTETPQEASAGKSGDTEQQPAEPVDADADDTPAGEAKDRHLAEGRKLPVPKTKQEAKEDAPKEKETPRERPEGEGDKEPGGKGEEQDAKKDDFSGHSQQTRVTGSISRQGKSALNVKNSPLGRYQALVSKAVELQWRRNCEQHRDHIVPGLISIRFYVDQNGRVSGVKFQEIIGANYIERGFTQRAIRQAKLPKMSKSVLEELKGEPLELIYNFYF